MPQIDYDEALRMMMQDGNPDSCEMDLNGQLVYYTGIYRHNDGTLHTEAENIDDETAADEEEDLISEEDKAEAVRLFGTSEEEDIDDNEVVEFSNDPPRFGGALDPGTFNKYRDTPALSGFDPFLKP